MTTFSRRFAARAFLAVAATMTMTWSSAVAEDGPVLATEFGVSHNLWVDRDALLGLPITGEAWNQVADDARGGWGSAAIADQESDHDVLTFAGALYAVRMNDTSMRGRVVTALEAAIGTERGGRTLALARNLTGYVLAADLIGYESPRFRSWLEAVRYAELDGRTLVSTHEERPNNWGAHAGAARIAADRYLGDADDLQRAANVFRGFLGDRQSYAGFKFGDDEWQADPNVPVPINPVGATKNGHVVDGALVDDLRRCECPVQSPAPREHYQWEGMQGIVTQATLLDGAGYHDVWTWSDDAIARAMRFLYVNADYAATDDDTFLPFLVDVGLGTDFSAGVSARSGKSLGYTDWTHHDGSARSGGGIGQPGRLAPPRSPVLPAPSFRVPVTGVAGVPGSGVSAVSLNLTAVNTSAPGFLRIWPCGSSEPATSVLNFSRGQVVANSMVVPVDDTGEVCVSSSIATDVIVDILGWFDRDVTVMNGRLLDTRTGNRPPGYSVLRLPLDGIPTNATGVSLTLTAVNTSANGFLRIWPCGSAEPGTSSLNFLAGQVVANSLVVPVDGTGEACIVSNVDTDIIVDVLGSFDQDITATARRLIDTRETGDETANRTLRVPLGDVPSDAEGISLTLTAVNTTGPGFLRIWPCGADEPSTSALNFIAGQVLANSIVLPVDDSAAVCVRSTIDTDIVIDTLGWFDRDPSSVGQRLLDTRES